MQNEMLNKYKALASYSIILLHCFDGNQSGVIAIIINALSRFAIPLYFMISGYYSYKSENITNDLIWRKVIHIVKFMLLAELLYFSYFFSFSDLLYKYTNIKDFLLFSKWGQFCSGAGWFLCALLFCYLSLFIMRKVKDTKIPIIISVILLLLTFLIQIIIDKNIPNYTQYTRNFWLTGFPLFYIGFFLKKYDKVFYRFSKQLIICIVIFSIIETLIVAFLCGLREIYIGSVFIAICILIYSNIYKRDKKTILSVVGGSLSPYIYIFHLQIIWLLGDEIFNTNIGSYIKPILACILSTMISAVYLFATSSRLNNVCSIKNKLNFLGNTEISGKQE